MDKLANEFVFGIKSVSMSGEIPERISRLSPRSKVRSYLVDGRFNLAIANDLNRIHRFPSATCVR